MRTEVREPGKVLRLSVAVIVDGAYDSDAKGARKYKPRNVDELKQIETLVKAGIGFDAKRGDQVTITNLQFAQLNIPSEQSQKAPFLGLSTADYIYIGQLAALVILGLVGLLFVARPLVMQLIRAANGIPTQVQGGKLAAATGGAIASSTQPTALGQSESGASSNSTPSMMLPRSSGSSIDISQIEGQVKDSSVKKVGEVVANHPEESVAILRNWLQQGD